MLGGCLVGPNYKEPVSMLPTDWSASSTMAPSSGERLTDWWKEFDDPVLDELIDRARVNNRDVRQAEARLREARAQRGIARAGLMPTISASRSANRSKASEEVNPLSKTGNVFSVGLDASWELDLFGGKRRAVEAATATLEASEESLRDVLVSLSAEVGLNYIDYRTTRALLETIRSSLASRAETYNLAKWRREAELTTELDVDQARLSLEQARAQVPALEASLAQSKHRLSVLLGEHPDSLASILKNGRPVPRASNKVALGVPADLLRRRPDIRAAERQLAAQTAQIGVAEAARYPNVSLVGSIGLDALQSGDLYTSSALAGQGLAQMAWTLFSGGRIREQIQVETARQEQAIAKYEATILAALQEVEDALVALTKEQERQSSLSEAEAAAGRAHELARNQYSGGFIDFGTVLDSQRSLLQTEEQRISSRAAISSTLVRLYKALGGGWKPPA